MAEPNFKKAIDFATGIVLLTIIGILALLTIAAEFVSGAEPRRQFDVTDIRVIDGDTLQVTAELGLEVTRRITVRLDDIDAFELRDKPRGPQAKAFVAAWFEQASGEILTTDGRTDKYGRVIGRIYDDRGRCLNELLLDAGHAAPYPRAK